MLKTHADRQRVSITATCIEPFTFFTSDLLLWIELKFYVPEGVLDSVVLSKQLLIHFIFAQVRLPAVTALKESMLFMGDVKPSWAGSALVPQQLTPINSFKHNI